jgi:hypothetical protein
MTAAFVRLRELLRPRRRRPRPPSRGASLSVQAASWAAHAGLGEAELKELAEFLDAGGPAPDPVFQERLRERLWSLTSHRAETRRRWTAREGLGRGVPASVDGFDAGE